MMKETERESKCETEKSQPTKNKNKKVELIEEKHSRHRETKMKRNR